MPSDPEYQALVDELRIGLEEAPLLISLSGTYDVEGDTLVITSATADEEGNEIMETVEFRRTDAASAVVRTTWVARR